MATQPQPQPTQTEEKKKNANVTVEDVTKQEMENPPVIRPDHFDETKKEHQEQKDANQNMEAVGVAELVSQLMNSQKSNGSGLMGLMGQLITPQKNQSSGLTELMGQLITPEMMSALLPVAGTVMANLMKPHQSQQSDQQPQQPQSQSVQSQQLHPSKEQQKEQENKQIEQKPQQKEQETKEQPKINARQVLDLLAGVGQKYQETKQVQSLLDVDETNAREALDLLDALERFEQKESQPKTKDTKQNEPYGTQSNYNEFYRQMSDNIKNSNEETERNNILLEMIKRWFQEYENLTLQQQVDRSHMEYGVVGIGLGMLSQYSHNEELNSHLRLFIPMVVDMYMNFDATSDRLIKALLKVIMLRPDYIKPVAHGSTFSSGFSILPIIQSLFQNKEPVQEIEKKESPQIQIQNKEKKKDATTMLWECIYEHVMAQQKERVYRFTHQRNLKDYLFRAFNQMLESDDGTDSIYQLSRIISGMIRDPRIVGGTHLLFRRVVPCANYEAYWLRIQRYVMHKYQRELSRLQPEQVDEVKRLMRAYFQIILVDSPKNAIRKLIQQTKLFIRRVSTYGIQKTDDMEFDELPNLSEKEVKYHLHKTYQQQQQQQQQQSEKGTPNKGIRYQSSFGNIPRIQQAPVAPHSNKENLQGFFVYDPLSPEKKEFVNFPVGRGHTFKCPSQEKQQKKEELKYQKETVGMQQQIAPQNTIQQRVMNEVLNEYLKSLTHQLESKEQPKTNCSPYWHNEFHASTCPLHEAPWSPLLECTCGASERRSYFPIHEPCGNSNHDQDHCDLCPFHVSVKSGLNCTCGTWEIRLELYEVSKMVEYKQGMIRQFMDKFFDDNDSPQIKRLIYIWHQKYYICMGLPFETSVQRVHADLTSLFDEIFI